MYEDMPIAQLWSTLATELTPVLAGYREKITDLAVEIKSDQTLLTEADVAVQQLIVQSIRDMEPDAVIIAEEDARTEDRADVLRSAGRVWVVDPIDGTAQFVQPASVEFCSVVCVLENWQPSSAFVLAPELGSGRVPIAITAEADTGRISLNGRPAPTRSANGSGWISVTRSGGKVTSFDEAAANHGYRLKKKTSSQTLDMVRTAVDLSALTEPALPSFDLFWRRDQKVWDGLAGMCLGTAGGLRIVTEEDSAQPLGPELLSMHTPVLKSTVMGDPETVSWFLDLVR
ncbi:inositol monophosphatase family protein [Amycolatopsis nigrescens]|uniref:inositol monophosphatase family protein n=1 Tax=Amycolatopsis nigrescens TaxID=381445 RepID=UPI000A0194C6|nr:inositol monophosphatase family protein [Amycolatopsis nigrescens]